MKINAEQSAEKLLKRLGINHAPIPVEEIAKQLDIIVQKKPLEGDLSGFLYRDIQKISLIGVNSSHNKKRQRFTIAHEIGHFILHEGNPVHLDRQFLVNFRDGNSNIEEIEANAFAASLLMPKKLVIEAVLEKVNEGFDLSMDSEVTERCIKELSEKFMVSKHALMIKLGNLGILS